MYADSCALAQWNVLFLSISVSIELILVMIGKDEVEIVFFYSFCIAASFDRTDVKPVFYSLLCNSSLFF